MKKINDKGQVLVVFVIILPLLILLTVFFIKKGYIEYEKNKINNILNIACKSSDSEEIIKENDNKLIYKINVENNKKTLIVKKKILDSEIRIKKVCD